MSRVVGYKHTAGTKAKIASANEGKPKSELHKEKLRQAQLGKKFPERVPATKDFIKVQYEGGKSIREIAEGLQIGQGKLYYWMKEFGIPMRSPRERGLLMTKGILSKEEMQVLYSDDKTATLQKIADDRGLSRARVLKLARKYGLKIKRGAPGRQNGHWNGGRTKTSWGYIYIWVPVGHPHRNRTGKAAEHIVVWEREHGPLPASQVIHHLNGIKDDNRLENLQAMNRKGPHGHHGWLVMQALQERIRVLEERLQKAEIRESA